MPWFLHRELTDDQLREVNQIKDELQLQDATQRLQLARNYQDDVSAKDDAIAELKRKLRPQKEFEARGDELDIRERELDLRDAQLDNAFKELKLRVQSHEEIVRLHEQDYDQHHTILDTNMKYAELLRQEVQKELTSAQTASRKAGSDEGYASGFQDGIARTSTLGREAMSEVADMSKLAMLAQRLQHPTTAVDGKAVEDPASKALADAFAKHLTGTIDQLMKPKKDTK
jgi:hypothetical protein